MAALRVAGRKALVAFITGGDPDRSTTVPALHALVDGGADVIEVGVPYSDPEADGPAIQTSSERALAAGTRLVDVLEMVREFRARDPTTPVLLMGYLNSIERMGYREFVARAADAGVDGMIVVNLPPEEAHDLHALMRAREMNLIFLVAPTSTPARIERIAARGQRLHLLRRAQRCDRRERLAHRRHRRAGRADSCAQRSADHGWVRNQGRRDGARDWNARRWCCRRHRAASRRWSTINEQPERIAPALTAQLLRNTRGTRRSMIPRTLDDWLLHAEQIHPVGIDMGLDRVREVAVRLGVLPPAKQNIVIAGTNGKGSTSIYLEALLLADGCTVGTTLSPHLNRFNERVRVNGSLRR